MAKSKPQIVIGSLCKRNHKYEGTEHSLRYVYKGKPWKCVECGLMDAKKRREKDPEARKAESKAWYEANKERALEASKAWREENQEKFKQYQRQYHASEQGKRKSREAQLRRLQALLANPSTVTEEYKSELLVKLKNKCPGCGCEFTTGTLCSTQLCWDHDLPISRGGLDSNENILPLCRSCNSSKRQKTFHEWKGFNPRLG